MPSRTGSVTLRSSSTSTTRTECSLWRNPRPKRSRPQRSSTSSPMCPNGGWPRSCPTPIASVRSSLSRSARATVREMPVTSSVCVSRVRKWSPSGATNTCVLCLSRRNVLECTIRSRSRWNGVRSEQSGSGRRRTAGYDSVARGDSVAASSARMRSAKGDSTEIDTSPKCRSRTPGI